MKHKHMDKEKIIIYQNDYSNTMVTTSTEAGEICLLRSSVVRSQTKALTRVSVNSLCAYNNKGNKFIHAAITI